MEMVQFRILYRKFLFRMVDVELLSPQADLSKLLGQFAALLIFLSLLFSLPAIFGAVIAASEATVLVTWTIEHFLIATTMLVVGLFAVMSWNSTFLDQHDVMVLAPLPVRTRTLFLAKVAAVASSLLLVVLLLNAFTSVLWTLALASHPPVPSVPALTSDAAMPPVEIPELKSLVDRDMTSLQEPGMRLAPGSGAGVTTGVWKHGARSIFAYGAAKPDSVFEIGSISKTFTGLVLAQMVAKGEAKLDEPVRALLPPGTGGKPRSGEITLLDLAIHYSGLPADLRGDPFPDYSGDNLYEFIGKRGLARPEEPVFRYSNLGFVLLGQALANRSGMAYPDLVQQTVTGPLGMQDTFLSVPTGRTGGIRSTAGDLITYLEANLHPERFRVLSAALDQSHRLRASFAPAWAFSRTAERIALAWAYDTGSGTYWHDGAAGSYSSLAFFNPQGDYAAVVLMNRGDSVLAGRIAQRIQQRLAGDPAVSLATVAIPASSGLADTIRWFLAFSVTLIAAGSFIFCCVLGLQGVAAQLLPRPLFLRVSSILQLSAFCILVLGYFLQPTQATEPSLIAAQQDGLMAWSPSYWFLGLFQKLTGSPALALLAHRSWIAMLVAGGTTAVAYVLSYFRTLRKIAEEPDIVPGRRSALSLPRFGKPLQTAIVQFSIRTLFRSLQHRVMLAFYLGMGFAFTILFIQTPLVAQFSGVPVTDPWHEAGVPLLASSILMMGFCLVGMRALVSLPVDLAANWIFRITPVQSGRMCLSARRRVFWLAAAVVWSGWAALLLWNWPWRPAVEHLAVFGLVGVTLAELCLLGPEKIPFTCSYLPGKSNFHMSFLACTGLVLILVVKGVAFEQRALQDLTSYSIVLLVLGVVAIIARLQTAPPATHNEPQFEDLPDPALYMLDLHQDGVPSIAQAATE